jgi:cyclophilin family peptidyl-prolyl cis-trans isomerase
MARTSAPDSATSQFYINTVDNPSLDFKSDSEPGYAVFGFVITGMDVIDKLNAVPVRVDLLSGLTHLPVTNVVILSALQTK